MKFAKKKMVGFLAGVLALSLITGTWAYFTSDTKIDNQLQTNNYGVKTVENFTPKQDLEPGKKITKEVGVTNTGDYDLVVRIKMDEKWERTSAGVTAAFKEIKNDDGLGDSTVKYVGDLDSVVYDAVADTWTAIQGPGATAAKDGIVGADDQSIIYKDLDLTDWIKGSDGYYYYKVKLTAGQNTGALLKAIVLASNADMGLYEDTFEYSTTAVTIIEPLQTAYDTAAAAYKADPTPAKRGDMDNAAEDLKTAYHWLPKTATDPVDESTITYLQKANTIATAEKGYANADYTLAITTEVCQATKEAVEATWPTMLDAVNHADLVAIKDGTDWALPHNA